jgi:hypothetical protein
MSEGYIGLAPSYGVFQKQVIAGTTATTYDLDFDVVQSTQLFVSLDGIVQEPDYSFSIARSSAGQMQIVFAEALTVTTATGNTTLGSASLTNITTTNINVGQGISGTGIPANTHVGAIATAGTASNGTLTLSNNANGAGTGTTFSFGARIFIVYLGKQLLTPSTTEDATVPLVEHQNGDASTVAFSLTRTPPNQASILVFVDGVFQRGSGNAYTLSGSTITFTGAPPTGTNNVTIHYVATQNNSVPTVADATITNAKLSLDYTDATYRAPTVDSSFAAATKTIKQISSTRYYGVNDVLVLLNGICLIPTTDYTISTTTLTLVEGAPATASSLVVRYLAL